jgi:hypothetical protein
MTSAEYQLAELEDFLKRARNGEEKALARLGAVWRATQGATAQLGKSEIRALAMRWSAIVFETMCEAGTATERREHERAYRGGLRHETGDAAFDEFVWDVEARRKAKALGHVAFLAHVCATTGALGFIKGDADEAKIVHTLNRAKPKNRVARNKKRSKSKK